MNKMTAAAADRRRRRRRRGVRPSRPAPVAAPPTRLPSAALLIYIVAALLSAAVDAARGAGAGAASASAAAAAAGPNADPAPPTSIQPSRVTPMRVAYQGEPGAYSEKSLRELLGPNVIAVGMPNFERCYRAVASREADYCLLPVENSLGGSIHENYDLMLRYDLTIVAEHEFRVKHCLLASPGVKRDDVKFAISHPQALAQCDNYLRGLDIQPMPTYDTAGSAKMIAENKGLPEGCTPQNTAAIASDLAGRTYGLDCLDKGIEDDTTNFTRFLLLGRQGVVQHLNRRIPSKTSIVFTLPNTPGALYKALACFSLRDIDFSKIESRPTSASLLSFLKFRSQVTGRKRRAQAAVPRFRYCFYLDFLASELDESAQYALSHLREQADFCRVLGSYPAKSRLVGPVADAVERLRHAAPEDIGETQTSVDDREREEDERKLSIGIVGYGAFGQFLGRKFRHLGHGVRCVDATDRSVEAERYGVEHFQSFDVLNFLHGLDVVVISVPIVDFEDAVTNLPVERLGGKLVVDVCPLCAHPKAVLTRHLPPDADIICSHPMFGPAGKQRTRDVGGGSEPSATEEEGTLLVAANKELHSPEPWDGQPFVYDRVRISNDPRRADAFLRIFERSRCRMVEMTSEQHDDRTADAEFVTHLTGRLLGRDMLPPTPVASKEYAALSDVADLTGGDTFDLFYGMFKFNDRARGHLNRMRENLARVERQLAAKEAYLAASAELRNADRRKLVAECRSLLEEAMRGGKGLGGAGGGDSGGRVPTGEGGSEPAAADDSGASGGGESAEASARNGAGKASPDKSSVASSVAFLSKRGKS